VSSPASRRVAEALEVNVLSRGGVCRLKYATSEDVDWFGRHRALTVQRGAAAALPPQFTEGRPMTRHFVQTEDLGCETTIRFTKHAEHFDTENAPAVADGSGKGRSHDKR
jgi:hypothetical protein